MKFLRIIIAVVVTAAVVYYGLNLLSPHHSDSEIIAGKSAAPSTSSSAKIPAEAPATASSSGLTEEQARQIGQQVGEQAANQVVQSMGSNSSSSSATAGQTSGLSEDQVRQIAHQEAESVVAAAMAHHSNSSHEAAESTHRARPTHDDDAATAKPAAKKPATKSNHHTEAKHAAEPKKLVPRKPAKLNGPLPPSTDALTTWWTPDSQVQAGQFALVYAGSAAFEKAVVLLFSNPVADATASGQSIKVTDSNGKVVGGNWRTSPQNPRMLIFSVPEGRYSVDLDKTMKDAQGHALARELHGPIYVR